MKNVIACAIAAILLMLSGCVATNAPKALNACDVAEVSDEFMLEKIDQVERFNQGVWEVLDVEITGCGYHVTFLGYGKEGESIHRALFDRDFRFIYDVFDWPEKRTLDLIFEDDFEATR